MSHNNHVNDGENLDLPAFTDYETARHLYLNMLEGWKDPFGDPRVVEHEGVQVVRDDLTPGTKSRAGHAVLYKVEQETVVYVQPRVGLAPSSILAVCEILGKRAHFFMPACKRISEHMAVSIERGATYEFHRIAAMPNLNRMAKAYADELPEERFFVPLGLKHPRATAAIVATASKIPEPDHVWVAVSTGVLIRSLQIAWPNAKFHAVCVARNMKAGELGRVEEVISEPLPFLTDEKLENVPPFPCIRSYDAKVWKYIPKNSGERHLMWNVGAPPVLLDPTIYDRVHSYRNWPKKELVNG